MKALAWITLGLALFFAVLYGLAAYRGWLDPDTVWATLLALARGPRAFWVGTALVIGLLWLDLVLPVPSSVVMTFSGWFLGFGPGALAAFAGSMAAAFTGFYACRWGGQRVFERLAGKQNIKPVDAWFRRNGVLAIIVSRPVPMLTEILSCLAGLTRLPARTFLAANLCGHIPVSLLYAWAGSRGARGEWGFLVFVLLLFPAAAWWLARKIRKRNADGSATGNP